MDVSRLRDVNAQKGIIFSTSGFQSGALDFAAAKHIATVAIVDGKWLSQTRAAGGDLRSRHPGNTSTRMPESECGHFTLSGTQIRVTTFRPIRLCGADRELWSPDATRIREDQGSH